MYYLVPEKPLRLVYGTFYLAIGDTFYATDKVDALINSPNSITLAKAWVQKLLKLLDSSFHRNDEKGCFPTFYEIVNWLYEWAFAMDST